MSEQHAKYKRKLFSEVGNSIREFKDSGIKLSDLIFKLCYVEGHSEKLISKFVQEYVDRDFVIEENIIDDKLLKWGKNDN